MKGNKKIEEYIEKLKDGLSEDQLNVFNHFIDNASSDKLLYVYSGYAGTGKTVLLSRIAKLLKFIGHSHHIAAFTGQASSVLISKGIGSATTIHRMMYEINEHSKVLEWRKKDYLEYDYIFIDEYSFYQLTQFKTYYHMALKLYFLVTLSSFLQ